ncbi:MAG TPA: hypothetical protein VK763_07590 [Terriglobales bacterium]|jgi:hypothetical protein|nr:hypothetical protein [Terriglobales bacterium]
MISNIFSGRRNNLASALLGLGLAVVLTFSASMAGAQTTDDSGKDKDFDLKSTLGDMHVGSDVDLRELGLPAYPGARLRTHDEDRSNANLALFTSAFGVKLLVAHYDTDDDAGKVVDFYRGKMKKYGKVLECHSSRHGGDVNSHVNIDDDDKSSNRSKELKCEGDNTGNVVELKVGTEDDQHVVAIEPAEKGKGSTIEMVYVHTRGKQGEI